MCRSDDSAHTKDTHMRMPVANSWRSSRSAEMGRKGCHHLRKSGAGEDSVDVGQRQGGGAGLEDRGTGHQAGPPDQLLLLSALPMCRLTLHLVSFCLFISSLPSEVILAFWRHGPQFITGPAEGSGAEQTLTEHLAWPLTMLGHFQQIS